MQENWSLGRSKSCAVGLLSFQKIDPYEKSDKKDVKEDFKKERKRSQSLAAFARQVQ